jgi:pentapeptide MXKDX repeat protein
VRRLVTIALSLSLLLGLSTAGRLFAQDQTKKEEAKKDDPQKDDAKKDDAKKEEAKKDDAKKDDAKKEAPKEKEAPKPPPPPTVPPEVQDKLEKARRAVAEAIVAAQDAGLVDTTVDPPPVLEILIRGYANDKAVLKAKVDELKANANAGKEAGVSPEVFGAWFTGFGQLEGVRAEDNVRIVPPSKGLSDFYRQRAEIMNRHIAEVRKAKGEAPKPAEAKKAAEPKKEEPKPEAKKEEAKKDEAKPEAKKDEPKKDESKEEPKKEEPKKDEPKKDEPKKDEPK